VKGRDAALWIGLWTVFNVVLSSLLFVFTTDLMAHVVYWLAIVWLLPLIGVAWLAREPRRRSLPHASGGAVVLALALAFVALGAGLGLWAALIGAVLGVVGVVMLVTERAA
jgi:FtsH-binding integral membrane protein